jgi:glycosyltransferase involved in cell wall biosynthesis
MHILLIHQAFASSKQAGGTRHFEFAQRCLKRGHRFTIVSSDISYLDGRRTTRKRQMVSKGQIGGVDILKAFTISALHRSFFWRVVSFVSFMVTSVIGSLQVQKVDLVLGTSPPIFQAVSAWMVAKLKGKPFLLEIRDLWPEFAVDMGVLKNPVLIWLSRILERFLYAQTSQLLVNSPAYRDYLITKGVSPEKISLISNGVDPDIFRPDNDGNGFRKEYDLEGKFVATYAGALGMANDIPTILSAAEKLKDRPDIHFAIVGDGKERRTLERRSQQKGLENVTFTGPKPKSDMPGILASSDVCLATLMAIPMFKTTYPNKVFDYMAAGRPIVLGIDGVIRDVVESAQGGIFVPPGNASSLADAVMKYFNDPELAKTMGSSARAYVVKHFNRNHQADQFIRLIELIQ